MRYSARLRPSPFQVSPTRESSTFKATRAAARWPRRASTSTAGASQISIGAALTNLGAFNIGNAGLSAATTVTAHSFSNSGALVVQGNAGASAAPLAAFDVAAAAAVTGNIRVSGGGVLDFGAGVGFKSIAVGAMLELDGAQASGAMGSGGLDSGLGEVRGDIRRIARDPRVSRG